MCRIEDVLDPPLEHRRNLEGQRKTRVVLPDLYCVYGLTGDTEALGQFTLGQIVFGPQHSKFVLHRYRRVAINTPPM